MVQQALDPPGPPMAAPQGLMNAPREPVQYEVQIPEVVHGILKAVDGMHLREEAVRQDSLEPAAQGLIEPFQDEGAEPGGHAGARQIQAVIDPLDPQTGE